MPKLGWRAYASRGIVVVLITGGSLLSANCRSAQYRIGQILQESKAKVVLTIAVEPQSFCPGKLICLSRELRKRYHAPEVVIGIFTSLEAAQNYRPPIAEREYADVVWASQQHAVYVREAASGEEYLLLTPDGSNLDVDSPYNTRIDLGTTTRPSCKLAIRERCLVALDYTEVLNDAVPGTVTMTGWILPDGTVDVAETKQVRTISSEQQKLAKFAERYLKTWHFEARQTKNTIRITFSVQHVDTPLKHGVEVQFMLPNRVNIQIGARTSSR